MLSFILWKKKKRFSKGNFSLDSDPDRRMNGRMSKNNDLQFLKMNSIFRIDETTEN